MSYIYIFFFSKVPIVKSYAYTITTPQIRVNDPRRKQYIEEPNELITGASSPIKAVGARARGARAYTRMALNAKLNGSGVSVRKQEPLHYSAN